MLLAVWKVEFERPYVLRLSRDSNKHHHSFQGKRNELRRITIFQRVKINHAKQPIVTSAEGSKAKNKDSNLRDQKDVLEFADEPEKFWKYWSIAQSRAAKNCSSKDECSCFEGLGSVM